jgi:hypothetical protein
MASLCISLIVVGFLLSSCIGIGAAADSSSSDRNEATQSDRTVSYLGQGRVDVTFGIPDFQSMTVPLTLWIDVQFAENYSQPGILVFCEYPVELPGFMLNRTSPTHVNGQKSGIAYLSGSREAFPFDSYVAIVKIHIIEGGLNFTEPSVYWLVPGFKESRSVGGYTNSTQNYVTIEVEQAIDRDPQWLSPIIVIMIFSPLAILAVIPLAKPKDQDAFSFGLAAIQPRIILALTLVTASLTLFEVFRYIVPPAGRFGFFTFPEVVSIVTIACGAIYLLMTLVWWSMRYGKLAYYDFLSSLLAAAIMFFLLDKLISYIQNYNPLYAMEALRSSMSSVRIGQILLTIAVVLPAAIEAVRESYRTRRTAKRIDLPEQEYGC